MKTIKIQSYQQALIHKVTMYCTSFHVNEAFVYFFLTTYTHACRLKVLIRGQSWKILTMKAFSTRLENIVIVVDNL